MDNHPPRSEQGRICRRVWRLRIYMRTRVSDPTRARGRSERESRTPRARGCSATTFPRLPSNVWYEDSVAVAFQHVRTTDTVWVWTPTEYRRECNAADLAQQSPHFHSLDGNDRKRWYLIAKET